MAIPERNGIRLHFLGGADSIGASATLVEIATGRILVDCGIRMGRSGEDLEGEVPLYRPEEIESLLERLVPVHFEIPFTHPASSPWSGRFFSAGHILGAAALRLESDAGSVFLSGDCALSEQRTVAGMSLPPVRASVAVIESTYGDRLHSDRTGQERALVQQIGAVYDRSGKVLIPAFAIGRAQEVLLILRSAIARDELPDHPVYVDGMVTPVCGVYASYPHYLAGRLYRRALRDRALFFSDRVRSITTPRERDAVLAGGPCTIVASSGMLSGGPSAWYAQRLASGQENLIAITGYQDEESPGRRLLDLAAGKRTDLLLPGGQVAVRCEVATYALSAHADSDELASLAARLRPDEIVLVHGGAEARASLSRKIHTLTHRDVRLPGNGEVVLARGRRLAPVAKVGMAARAEIGQGRPIDADAVLTLYTHLLNEGREKAGRRLYSLVELAERWKGGVPSREEVDAWAASLKDDTYFTPDRKRPFLFRLRPLEEAHETFLEKQRDENRSPWSPVFEQIRCTLGPDAGIVKESYQADRKRIILHFRFPAIAERRHGRALQGIAQETGWEIEIHPNQNKAILIEKLRECLGTGIRVDGCISHRDDLRLVRIRVVEPDEAAREVLQDAAETFLHETGWSFEWTEIAAPAPRSPTESGQELSVAVGADLAPAPDGQPMEINASYRLIAAEFAADEDHPYVARKTVVVRPAAPLDPSVVEELCAAYAASSGYQLDFEQDETT